MIDKQLLFINSDERDSGTVSDFHLSLPSHLIACQPHQRMRLALNDVVIPYTWYNVQETNRSFQIVQSGTTHDVTLDLGSFHAIQLRDHLNTKLSAHGVTCSQPRVAGYSCACAKGYRGGRCKTDVDECASRPCANGGTCKDRVASYACTCVRGWRGATCAVDANECGSSPCKNQGKCTDGLDRFTCSCSTGWSGKQCTVNTDECASRPCDNGGSCKDRLGAYACSCTSQYFGVNCQYAVDACASVPCKHGGYCNGTTIGKYVCNCAAGYVGAVCGVERAGRTRGKRRAAVAWRIIIQYH